MDGAETGTTSKINKKFQISKKNLEDLPNEVILKVFSYLEIVDIIRCGQVSKRIRAISHDNANTMWQKINLYDTLVPAEFLQHILKTYNIKYLNLNCAMLKGNLRLEKPSKLKYLDLSRQTLTCQNNKFLWSIAKLSHSSKSI